MVSKGPHVLKSTDIRLPFNYRHFIDDQNPQHFKPEGFALLDRVVNICGKYNLYVVLDLHAAPGGQNQDWHSDAGLNKAMFWEFQVFPKSDYRSLESHCGKIPGKSRGVRLQPAERACRPRSHQTHLVVRACRESRAGSRSRHNALHRRKHIRHGLHIRSRWSAQRRVRLPRLCHVWLSHRQTTAILRQRAAQKES